MRTPALGIAEPGTVLAGKLRVERLIGQGAMGVVYEATDTILRKRVAVKLVHPDHLSDPEKRRRFGREAYAVARLESAHVTRVLEISELDDGTPYLVMELLEGRTLDGVLDADGPPPVHVALDWILQALDAIAEAHAIGLVHRDFKPANLFLQARGDGTFVVKLIDFGLVKDLATEGPKLTAAGATMGSPAYMAPEQVDVTRTVDPRTDVWAVGVTLFELLTGQLPWDGNTIPSLLHQILHDAPASLGAVRPDAPPELQRIVERCLAKDPNDRFADGGALLRELAPLRARLPQVTESTRTVRLPDYAASAFLERPSAPTSDSLLARPSTPSFPTPMPEVPAPAPAPPPDPVRSARTATLVATLISAVVVGGAILGAHALLKSRSPRTESPPGDAAVAPP